VGRWPGGRHHRRRLLRERRLLESARGDHVGPLIARALRAERRLRAGHVGFQLARAASDAGFRIQVVDDREKFANAERFPGAEVVVEPIPDWLHRADLPATAYIVVVTRGHQNDLEAVRALAARDYKYLGLIGSRAKVARIYDALRAEGMPPECLARVHAPIGLEIGAVTPGEIAISILAELIAVRRGVDTAAFSMKRA
jgi:xanthine dehydrogenase accessory factor